MRASSNPPQNIATPAWFMDAIRERLNIKPTLDVCAEKRTAVCGRYFDEEIDGLDQDWCRGWWCNPPWNDIAAWVAKAKASPTGVMLLPARVDIGWFADIVRDRQHLIIFITPRLGYYYPDGWKKKDGTMHEPAIRAGISHGSMLVEYNSKHPGVCVEEIRRPRGEDGKR